MMCVFVSVLCVSVQAVMEARNVLSSVHRQTKKEVVISRKTHPSAQGKIGMLQAAKARESENI